LKLQNLTSEGPPAYVGSIPDTWVTLEALDVVTTVSPATLTSTSPGLRPNLVANLEETPWPWATDSVDTVVLNHGLEHMCASADRFLESMICIERPILRLSLV
jgi:hypothetical protein